MTVTADALDLLAGDPPRYPHMPGDFRRHPETGAPYVNHPTEITKDGRPRRVMYGRPSSFGSALDNPFNLLKWKERQLLIGATIVFEYGADELDVTPDDRAALDALAAKCHEEAGTHLAADQGTHIHLLTEASDRGQISRLAELFRQGETLGIPEPLQRQILIQWEDFRSRLGLTALAIEQTVVNDRWRLAGTLDRLDVADHDILTAYGVLEAGQPFVGDIKTGGLTLGNDGQPSYWVKYSVQLAAYVDAQPYDVETDERADAVNKCRYMPHRSIALIYHYDLARALAGEVVDWAAIPVNVDAGREGGDLCRAAADFAKRRDLFAMPAPTNADRQAGASRFEVDQAGDALIGQARHTVVGDDVSPVAASPVDSVCHKNDDLACSDTSQGRPESAVPVGPNPTVEQQAADPEPSTASTAVPGTAVPFEEWLDEYADGEPNEVTGADELRVAMAWDRACLRARIKDLVDQGHEQFIRQWWPEGVPTLKHDGHSDAQLQLILACVRRVEAEVGAGWHPDDGPPPHVNTNPRASIDYPVAAVDEGGPIDEETSDEIAHAYEDLPLDGMALCRQIAQEAHVAGRSISVSASPTVRRWSIARAVIAWAASGRTLDDMWFAASNLATFEQCCDPSATLGGLISQFTIEQADRLYQAAGQS